MFPIGPNPLTVADKAVGDVSHVIEPDKYAEDESQEGEQEFGSLYAVFKAMMDRYCAENGECPV